MKHSIAQSPSAVTIGGPETALPTIVESFFSWCLCISCLSVSGYHWCASTLIGPMVKKIQMQTVHIWANSRNNGRKNELLSSLDGTNLLFRSKSYLPLTTASRNEISRMSAKERHDQLMIYLRTHFLLDCSQKQTLQQVSDSELIHLFRSSEICRRLASLLMRPYWYSCNNNSKKRKTCILEEYPDLLLPQRFAILWSQLLTLPSYGLYCGPEQHLQNDDDVEELPCSENRFPFLISLIVPAFRENGTDIQKRLIKAHGSCVDPMSIELILVDAGGCSNLERILHPCQINMDFHPENSSSSSESTSFTSQWGNAIILPFQEGGGRGPCLNFGAKAANGKILTFLHSDTTLPSSWDKKIIDAFQNQNQQNDSTKTATFIANSCAFSFGIDTSEEGLSNNPCPPGINAVKATANLRTHLFSLPYGDQCISVPSTVFQFVGGFPDQCLMEDYELVSLLRQRAADNEWLDSEKEKVVIIGGDPALCSPRRWQKFGVLYVTFMNSKLVNLYSSGSNTPDDLFERYYGVSPTRRRLECSPWEVDLDDKSKVTDLL